jgi:predicted RNase H-like nuclease
LIEAVGVDWAGRRWVVVVLKPDGVVVTTEPAFDGVVDRFSHAAAIAVDIPIGLPADAPWRRAELEAAKLVPPSTVFPTYPAAVYQRPSHAQAVVLCTERGWPGISRQSYGLWTRMVEVEPYADVVHEVHPEVCFWKMNGEAKLVSKHTWNGFFERRRLLKRHGITLPEQLPENARAADVLDASAAAWTASRIASNDNQTLPAVPHGGEPTIAY